MHLPVLRDSILLIQSMQLVIHPFHPLRTIQLRFSYSVLPPVMRKLTYPIPVLMSCLGWVSNGNAVLGNTA